MTDGDGCKTGWRMDKTTGSVNQYPYRCVAEAYPAETAAQAATDSQAVPRWQRTTVLLTDGRDTTRLVNSGPYYYYCNRTTWPTSLWLCAFAIVEQAWFL